MASCLSQDILHCQEMWAYGQLIVGHRRTSYRECPTKIRGLVMIAQTSVRNGTDTRLRRFHNDVQGKSKKNFLLQSAGGHGNQMGTPERI
jgi:hypothetical protein